MNGGTIISVNQSSLHGNVFYSSAPLPDNNQLIIIAIKLRSGRLIVCVDKPCNLTHNLDHLTPPMVQDEQSLVALKYVVFN